MATNHNQSYPPRWRIWWHALRPRTLPAAMAPVLIGTAIAYGDGKMHRLSALAALLGALLIQIGTNLANDYFDGVKGTDEGRLGPVRATGAGLIPPAAMRNAFILVFALALLPGLYLAWRGGWPIMAIGVLSIAAGILYTGGPWPLGYNGLGDVFVFVFFGLVAVAGTYYVQAQSIYWLPLLAGVPPGLLSMAILAVNNFRDMDGDARAGKRTLAVRFGATFARREYLYCVVFALALPLWLCMLAQGHWFAMAAFLLLFKARPLMIQVFDQPPGRHLNQVLADTGKLLSFYSLVFAVGWVI